MTSRLNHGEVWPLASCGDDFMLRIYVALREVMDIPNGRRVPAATGRPRRDRRTSSHRWEAARQAWLRENQAALEDYNRRVERTGVFSEGLRRF